MNILRWPGGRGIRRAVQLAFLSSLLLITSATPWVAHAQDPAAAGSEPGKPLEVTEAKPPGNQGDQAPTSAPAEVVDAYREGREFVAGAGKDPKKVREYCAKRSEDEDCRERRTARLNEIIYVKVANLEGLLQRSKCFDVKTKETIQDCTPREIVLFLNGRPMRGLSPESGAPELEPGGEGTLRYHLTRYEGQSETAAKESNEHWADLLGLDPAAGQFRLIRPDVNVSVGLEDDFPIKSSVSDFRLRRMRGRFLIGFLFLAAGIIYGLIRLAKRSGILRDRKPVLWGHEKPYSLSATQAAWWFVLTIMSFVFIWLVTGAYDLSMSVLVLLGIGFGTALGSTVIDQNKRTMQADGSPSTRGELETLLLEMNTTEATLDRLTKERLVAPDKAPLDAELETARTRYATVIRQIRGKFPNAVGPQHESFILDVLSDASGVNFHRFQMAVWTVVLGLIFVYSVLSRLAMPVFSDTLLGLMGLSAGTFLGFKIPENSGSPSAQPPASGGSSEPPAGNGATAATNGGQAAADSGSGSGTAAPAAAPVRDSGNAAQAASVTSAGPVVGTD